MLFYITGYNIEAGVETWVLLLPIVAVMCCAVVDKMELEQSVMDELHHSPPEQFKDSHQGQAPSRYVVTFDVSK